MQITKELRARIDRVFKDKADKLWGELDARIRAYNEEHAPEVMAKVRAMLNDLNHDPAIRAAVKASLPAYRKEVEEVVVDKYLYNLHDALYNERDGIKKKIELEKESLMIAISYSDSLEDVKKVFADFGLDF